MKTHYLLRTFTVSGSLLLSLCAVSVLESCKGSSDPSSRLRSRGAGDKGSGTAAFGLYNPKGGDEVSFESRTKSWSGDTEPADWSQVDQVKERVLGLYNVNGDSSCILRKETTIGNLQTSTITDVCKAASRAASECSTSKCDDPVDVGAKTFGTYQDSTGKKVVCRSAYPTTLPGDQKKVTISYSETTSYTHPDAQNDENLVFQSTRTCSTSVDDNGQSLDSYLTQDPCASTSPEKIVTKSEKELKSFTAGQGSSDYTVRPSAKFWVKNESKESRDAEPIIMLQKMSTGSSNDVSISVSKTYCEKDTASNKNTFKNVSFSTTLANQKAENAALTTATLLDGSSVFMSQDGCNYSLAEKSDAAAAITGSVSCTKAFTSITDQTASREIEALEFTSLKPDGFGATTSGSDSTAGGNNSSSGSTVVPDPSTASGGTGNGSIAGNGTNGSTPSSNPATNGSTTGSQGSTYTPGGGQQASQVTLYGAGGPRGASFVLSSLTEARKCAARIAAMSKVCLSSARYGQVDSTTATVNYIVPGARWCTCDNGIGYRNKLPWKKGSVNGF